MNTKDEEPDDTAPKTTEDRPLTHEELVAAAVSELIGEGAQKPPEWFQGVYDNT